MMWSAAMCLCKCCWYSYEPIAFFSFFFINTHMHRHRMNRSIETSVFFFYIELQKHISIKGDSLPFSVYFQWVHMSLALCIFAYKSKSFSLLLLRLHRTNSYFIEWIHDRPTKQSACCTRYTYCKLHKAVNIKRDLYFFACMWIKSQNKTTIKKWKKLRQHRTELKTWMTKWRMDIRAILRSRRTAIDFLLWLLCSSMI